MQSLASSKIKTEHSFIDLVSVNEVLPTADYTNQIEQTTKIVNWSKRLVSNGVYLHNTHQTHNNTFSYFLIKVDSLHHLPFRRVNPKSKVFVLVTGIVINTKTGKQYFKTTKTFKQLQENSAYLFDLKQSLYYYYYTPNEKDLFLQLEILVTEQVALPQQKETIFMNFQSVGFLQIELNKERKVKEKCQIIHPGMLNLFNKQNAEKNSAYAYVVTVKTEVFKPLQKLLPCDTICDSSDRIPGVLGYFLPNNQNSISEFSLTTEAKGLMINSQEISINQSILKDNHLKCEKILASKYKGSNRIQCFCNQLILKVSFHNSWKKVSECEVALKEKQNMQGVLKTHQSIISGMQVSKSKQNISFGKLKQKKEVRTHYKHFSPAKPIELDLIFPEQEQCVLVLQVYAHFNASIEFQLPNNKPPIQLLKQDIKLPICFALVSAKSLSKLRFQALRLNEGCPLTSIQALKNMINNEIKRLQEPQLPARNRKVSKQSAIRMEVENVSAVKSGRTLSNLTHYSIKDNLTQLGLIQFQIQIIEKEPVAPITNRSLGIENVSALNISRLEIKDKINAQKERIAKQSKKAMQPTRKIQIQFFKNPKINENQVYEITSNFIKESSQQKQNEKQNILKYLKKYIPHMAKQSNFSLKEKRFQSPGGQLAQKKLQSMAYYKLMLSHNLQSASYQPTSLPTEFYLLYSNYHYNQNLSSYLYQKVPSEVIKTQLAQIMYNNCFFFNFDHFISGPAESSIKLPQIFFLKTQFWNESPIRSQLLTVNKDTGEVTVFGIDEMTQSAKKQASKIMHIEVSMDESIDNYQMCFIHFVEYLYNGLLKMQIVDYNTSHTYGYIYLPLRNLIRKRRNEAIVVHQTYIYHKNFKKGRVRVQMRAIRKIRQIKGQSMLIQNKSSPQVSPRKQDVSNQQIQTNRRNKEKQQQQKRQQQRISKFKQAKSKADDNRTIPKQLGKSRLETETELKQLKHIEQIVINKYIVEKKTIKVNFLTRHYFFITINNKQPYTINYQLVINDEDAEWIMQNPLSGGQELVLVKNIGLMQPEDLQKLQAIKKNIQPIANCKTSNEQGIIQMQPNQKGTLLLCYLSVRKYSQPTANNNENTSLSIYNRQRIINCSFIDTQTNTVEALYSIQITPVPDLSSIQLQYYRPHSVKSTLHLPIIEAEFISSNIDQIMTDDPYILVAEANFIQNRAVDKKINKQKGILVEASNDLADQKNKIVNIILLNDVAHKTAMSNTQNSNTKDKSRLKMSNQVRQFNNYFGPSTISISLNIKGCPKIQCLTELWQQSELVYQLKVHSFEHMMQTNCFYILSDDQQSVKISKHYKSKNEGNDIFKIIKQRQKIKVYMNVLASKPGLNYVHLHIIEAIQLLQQQQALKTYTFKQVEPLYKMVLSIYTRIPVFKQVLKININRTNQQKVIEQPFNYRSMASKKTQYRVMTSEPHLLWVKQSDSVFQLESRGQRKITLYFNIEQLLRSSQWMGVTQKAVLGVKWDKGIQYFSFRFNIY